MSILHDMIRRSPRLREGTKKGYLADVDTWIAFAGEDPAAWTRYKAQDFYEHFLRGEKKLKPQSANRVMMSLRYAASWWAKMESNPALDFTQIQMAANALKDKREALSPEEATLLIHACRKGPTVHQLRDFALIVCGLETGMRRSSLAGMMLDSTTIVGPNPGSHVPIKGQTEAYFVPLSATACKALAPWVRWLFHERIKTGSVFRGMPRSVDHAVNKAITDRQIYNIIAERAVDAGIRRTIHPHLFRHSFVTWRTEAGVAPHLIGVITGHRLKGDPMSGAMAGYVDKTKLYDLARNTTPDWLAELVEKELPQ